MTGRRVARLAAVACVAVFLALLVWDLAVQRPRLAGSQICAQDAESAKLSGADGPGVYRFDRSTGSPVRVPPTVAFGMIVQGTFKSAYSTQRACGVKALTQTWTGVLVVTSLLCGIVAAVVSLLAKR
jgi:hypothetical protein